MAIHHRKHQILPAAPGPDASDAEADPSANTSTGTDTAALALQPAVSRPRGAAASAAPDLAQAATLSAACPFVKLLVDCHQAGCLRLLPRPSSAYSLGALAFLARRRWQR